ncbi:MAG: signal recognition particle protein [Candidatus Babeliales bacterium]
MFDFLTNKFSSVFSYFTGQKYLSEKNMNDTISKVHDALIEADVPYNVVQKFINEVKQETIGKKVLKSLNAGEQFAKIIHEKLVLFLGGNVQNNFEFKVPSLILVMGLQGSGKTTTIAKLTYYIKQQKKFKNRAVLLASVDFYRPAAIDQLEILSKQVGVQFYRAAAQNSFDAAKEIYKYAQQHKFDLVFLDTAGRMHIDNTMLEELRNIDNSLQPKHKLLVLDAMTGQESLKVAKAFDQAIGFEGVILSKMDSETRAGAAFAFKYELNKPILFLGTGEKVDELQLFRPERIAGRILGMGDVQSLIEHANQKIKKNEQEDMEQAFKKDTLTLSDFAKQLEMMNRLGSFSQLMQYIPGANSKKVSADQMAKAEQEITQFKVIFSSMTLKEQLNHKILNGSRRMRIAKGAGVQVSEVDVLLSRFEQMQQFVKLFKRGKFPNI